jgi:hypothetical protein
MPVKLTDEVLALILARAGLNPTDAQKAELKRVYPNFAAMAERVRRPRGIMAEPAHTCRFDAEDQG